MKRSEAQRSNIGLVLGYVLCKASLTLLSEWEERGQKKKELRLTGFVWYVEYIIERGRMEAKQRLSGLKLGFIQQENSFAIKCLH